MTFDVAGSHLPESLYGPCGCQRYREINTPKSKVQKHTVVSRSIVAERKGTMARNGLRTRPPGVDPMAADGDRRRIPFVSIYHITHSYCSLAYPPILTPSSSQRQFRACEQVKRESQMVHATFSSSKLSTLPSSQHWFCIVLILLSCSFTQRRIIIRQVPGSSQPNQPLMRCLGEIWVSDCMLH